MSLQLSRALRLALALVAGVLSPAPARAARFSAGGSAEAMALCKRADQAPDGEKRDLLERGLAAAETAVAADDADAGAHFAVFCNLGKKMRLGGISLVNLVSLHRLRREIDRTLELEPDDADALVGKAALLYYTPRLLGGDPEEGERLLRRALVVAPRYLDARLALARLLDARGDRDGARAAARRALSDAEGDADPAKATEARHLLEHLGD